VGLLFIAAYNATSYMVLTYPLFGETRAFGYSSEDVQMVIESMASQGKEPTFCMGDDIPLAALSQKPHMLFDYFKQRFAQVSKTTFLQFILQSNSLFSKGSSSQKNNHFTIELTTV
jgi:hypothetical protein